MVVHRCIEQRHVGTAVWGQVHRGRKEAKNAIEMDSMGDLSTALEALKQAVASAELDAQIEQAADSQCAGFEKKK